MKIIISILTLLLLLTGCRQINENEVIFDTVVIDKSVKLSNEANSPICTIHLSMAYATEDNGHKAEVINQYINDMLFGQQQEMAVENAARLFADEYTEAYSKNLLPLYNQDRADSTKRAWYDYHYVITTNTQIGCKGTIVYLATVDSYEGGANSMDQLLTLNFEPKTGRLLNLSDIFVDGYELELNRVLLQALKEKTGTKSMSQLREKGFLKSLDMYPSENFILDDETMTFIYNPSEIAPYSEGSTELIIPYTNLKSIIRNSFNY